jgi:Family of unknown function (DUF6488)
MISPKKLLVGLLLALSGLAVSAHPQGHDFPLSISRMQVIALANAVKEQLIASKKVPAVWTQIPVRTANLSDMPQGAIWVVRYRNEQEKDSEKQMLYIYIDDNGNYLGINYTGKL